MLFRRTLTTTTTTSNTSSQLANSSTELQAKASAPWTSLSLQDKKDLYARQYEMCLCEEENQRHRDDGMPLMFVVLAIGVAFGYAQHLFTTRVGIAPPGRTNTNEWKAATKQRHAK